MVKNLIKSLKRTPTSTGTKMMVLPKRKGFSAKWMLFSSYFTVFMMTMFSMVPVFASSGDPTATVGEILEKMISIIGMIFVAVGIILAIYSVGQLILAFKNEDADSKSRASTLLVVAIILIAFPALINFLGLSDYLNTALSS